ERSPAQSTLANGAFFHLQDGARIWEHTRPRATVGARIHARAAVLSEPISPRRVVGARLHEPGEHRQAPPLTPPGSPTVIRLTWRQLRTQAAVAIGGLA